MVQDVERLAIARHLAHVLRQRLVVQLHAGQDEHAIVARGNIEPVVVEDAVLVVRDGEEVVAQLAVARDHLVDWAAAIGERRVGVEVAFEERHAERAPHPLSEQGRRAGGRAAGGTESQMNVMPKPNQPLFCW